MPIDQISRQVGEVNVSAAYQAKPEDTLIVCNATGGAFTVTLYRDQDSGAYHRLVVKIADDDVSGNAVTITDGTFSTQLDATSSSVELETDYDGDWIAVANFPTTDAATASSKADSAGLAASAAESAAVSGAAGGTGASQATSVATSQNLSQSTTISTIGSVAASATLSGVSATASVATSQNVSQSATVSVAQSTAAS